MANANVHTGLWIDHSRGSVLEANITLNSKYGSQLVSAAAIVVQLTGVALWTLLAFAIHQRRATTNLRDEFDAQLQVLLRNSAGADSAAWNIFRLGKVWRRRRPKALKHAGALAALPALVYIGFIVAGVFVGQIATNNNNLGIRVLLKEGTCGFIEDSSADAGGVGLSHVEVNVSTVSRQYAQSCYGGVGSASAISCSVYAKPSLEYTVNAGEPCPIPYGPACFNDTESTAVNLMTGSLDSHDDLGINAPKSDRLTLQYQATCAPMAYDFIDSFVTRTSVSSSPAYPNTTLESYGMGSNGSGGYLYSYAPIIRQWGVGSTGYYVNTYQSLYPHRVSTSGFVPVAPFNQTMADLTLFLIVPNGITYTGAVQDAIYRTPDQPTLSDFYSGPGKYVPIRNVSVLACGETWQICNPAQQKCTGWSTTIALEDVFADASNPLSLNSQQNATYLRLAITASQASMFRAVNSVPSPLLASSYLTGNTVSVPLADGFWRQEIEGWFQAALAKIQYLQVIYTNIPQAIVQANNISIVAPPSAALKQQCGQQRVTAPQQYQNYNLFALIFILCFGIVIPAISIAVKFIYPRYAHLGPKLRGYQAEGTLQLHRMALEGAGYAGWTDTSDDIPRTAQAEKRIPPAGVEGGENEEEAGTLRYPKNGEGWDEGDSQDVEQKGRKGWYQRVLG